MDCPYCKAEMKKVNVFRHCGGRFLRWHSRIQFTALDGSFQTRSAKIANWFARNGYRVSPPRGGASFYDMYPTR